jgi:cytoskeletal protein RodZ
MMRTTLFTLAALAATTNAAVHKRQDGEITLPVVSLPDISSDGPASTGDAEVTLPVVSSTLPQETTDTSSGGDDGPSTTITIPIETTGMAGPTNTTMTVTTTTSAASSTVVTEITTTNSDGEDVTITSTEVVEPTDGGDGDGEDPATTLETETEPGAAPTHFVGNAAAGLVALAGLAAII